MKNIIKTFIITAITTIIFIGNTSFAAPGGGGVFGHGPNNGGNQGPLLGPGPSNNGGMSLGGQNIYNGDLGNVIDIEIDNPIEDGAKRITPENAGLVGTDDEITDYIDALTKVLKVIQNVVNYALGLLGTIALIYLIIHGFIILTAAGDDSKVKKGYKGIKNAFIAITGIGLSRIIIRFILRLISYVAS